MKTRLLIMFTACLFSFALIHDVEALREVLTVDEMSKRSDAIAVGIIQSTWIDIRLFDDYPVVDTARVKVDGWFKNNQNSDTLEIRYYGYWAKTIDDLRGKYIFDNPVFDYSAGQKVLVILDHEDNTAVMGGGYYPFFEGSFVIDDDVAISQVDAENTLQYLYNTINGNLDVSQEQRLDNILRICKMFGAQPNEKKIQSANDTHYINNQECQWNKRSNSGVSLDRTVYPEPESISTDQQNLLDARDKLRTAYHANVSWGSFNIKDAIVGYGIGDGFLVVDVLEKYYSSDRKLIEEKIIDITGGDVNIEFNSSKAIVPTNVESVFPYVWNGFLHRNGIEFTPKEQPYGNYDIGYDGIHRVCSPIVASNGTELYVSSVFVYEPFEITGTYIDKIKPDDCYKIWKTGAILVEPDLELGLWLENYWKDEN